MVTLKLSFPGYLSGRFSRVALKSFFHRHGVGGVAILHCARLRKKGSDPFRTRKSRRRVKLSRGSDPFFRNRAQCRLWRSVRVAADALGESLQAMLAQAADEIELFFVGTQAVQ